VARRAGSVTAGTGRHGVVLHLVPALFDASDGIVGGAERYVLELARHMAEQVPTRLVTFGRRARTERIGSLDIRVIGDPWYVRGQRGNPFAPALVGEVRRAAVVHCHQQHVIMSSVAAFVSRLSRARVVCSDLGGGGWDVSAYVSTDRWYHAHLHISEYSRRVAGHEGWPRARVIFGGVDVTKFSPDPSSPHDGAVLFVGRLLPHKGINDLIDALEPGTCAEIIGSASHAGYVAALEERARGKSVRFRIGCDDTELVAAYRRASCVVLPSVYRDMYGQHTRVPELLGQTLLEGMACGCACIATDVASLPEVVQHEVTGLVVPPNDPAALGAAIRRIQAHPAERRAMGERGRQRVLERFTWPAVVRQCLEAYAA
jgi:glycosyltransferase involved in cell wall biosynthesis